MTKVLKKLTVASVLLLPVAQALAVQDDIFGGSTRMVLDPSANMVVAPDEVGRHLLLLLVQSDLLLVVGP